MLGELERLGLRDNTLIVFTSDHGIELLEHGGWDMGLTLYDENLHVPFIMAMPGVPA